MYRNIDTGLWHDPKIETLSGTSTYLWVYLLTSPSGNLCGCFEISQGRISLDTKLSECKVSNAIAELEQANVIRFSAETSEVLITNWCKYNWTKSKKLVKPLVSAIKAVKDASFKAYLASLFEDWFSIPYPYPIDTVSIPYRYPSVSVSVYTNDKDRNSNTSTSKRLAVDKGKRYGEFSNVVLSDREYESLKEKFPSDYSQRIDDLSFYIGSTGKAYKSHYRTILAWDRRNSKPVTRKGVTADERFAKYR